MWLLSYRPDLFDRSSVEAIAGRLVRLLEGAVADPERAIGRLDILGADEREERRGSDGSPAGIEGALEYASDLFERSSGEAIAGRLVRLLEGAVADPDRAIGGSTFWALTSGTRFCGSGTRPRGRFRVRRYPSCSRRRLRARLRRTRWCSRTSGSATASSMRVRAGWRITCARSGSGPRWWWGCASSARWRCWWGLSASSRPGARICRSIRIIRPSGLRSCWRDAGAPVLLTRAALRAHLPAHDAHVVCLDADWPAIARQGPDFQCGGLPSPPGRREPLDQ